MRDKLMSALPRGVLALSALVLATAALISAEPTAPKKPRVDYARLINERNGPTPKPDENAVVYYLRAVGPMHIKQPEVRAEFLRQLGIELPDESPDYFLEFEDFLKTRPDAKERSAYEDQETESVRRPWKGDEFPVLRDWLEANAKPLDTIVAGGKCEKYYAPIVLRENEHISGVSARAPIFVWSPAFALRSRAMLKLGEGDALAGWEDLMALRRMGAHFGRGLTSVEITQGASFDIRGAVAQMQFCQHLPMTRELATRFVRDASDQPLPDFRVAVGEVDRCWVLEAIDRLERGETAAEWPQLGEEASAQLNALADADDVDWAGMRSEIKLRYTDLARAAQVMTRSEKRRLLAPYALPQKATDKLQTLDFKGRGAAVVAAKTNTEKARIMRDWYGNLALESVDNSLDYRLACLNIHRVLRIVIALEAHRAAKGTPPEQLAALVPDYLDEMPLDVMSEKPFDYRRAGEGYLLWGVGGNGKSEFDVEQFLLDKERQYNDDPVYQWRM